LRINPKKGVDISVEIVRQIKTAIANRTLSPGHRLPAEREWAMELGVSRATLRDAIKVLSGMGLLQVRRNKGVFIANPESLETTLNRVAEVLLLQRGPLADLFEVRIVLESQAARWAAERAPVEIMKRLQHAYQCLLDKQADGSLTEEFANEIDRQIHRLISEGSGNAVLINVVENLRELQESSRSLGGVLTARRIATNVIDLGNILGAIEMRDGLAAHEAMMDHLTRGEIDNRAIGTKNP
jgi:GntR family transcriptional regulator, transcriptional repressor for pyruvate dehydrogenase complex